jgi:subtilisin family serine protease
MKLVGGSMVATAGYSGVGAADNELDVSTDDDGNAQWLLRFGPALSQADDSADAQDLQQTALSTQQQAVNALSSREEYTVERQFWIANATLVTAEKDPESARSELESLSGVDHVHPNFEVDPPEPVEKQELIPKDHGTTTYGLQQINATNLWEQFDTKGEGASVAVLDTGIDADHPDIELADDGWAFFDANGNEVDTEPFDNDGHGTHVSGTISGGDASGAHIGVAPEVDLYNAKVLNNGGTFAQIIAGMQWAVEKGVDIINMSLGATGFFDQYIEPVQNTVQAGTIVVTSSGNSGAQSSGSPGNVYDSFSVGASNSSRDIVSFSSGERVQTQSAWTATWLTDDWPLEYYVPDISAPGFSVLSSVPDGEYSRFNGTSMASPHVAGAAALLKSIDEDLSVSDIMTYLENTAMHGDGPEAEPDSRYGKGIIDVLSAATAMGNPNTIEGTVTGPDGNPMAGTTVSTDYGTWAETDSQGQYSLMLPDGDWELSVDDFGIAMEAQTLTISGGVNVTQDFSLENQLDLELLAGQADVAAQGEAVSVGLDVRNLESLTVTLTEGSTLSAENLTLSLDGTQFEVGETLDLGTRFSGAATLLAEVADDAPTGSFGLAHEFDGPGGPLSVETGPTEVMEDPQAATLEIIDWGQTENIGVGEVLQTYAVVKNTGDYSSQKQAFWWLTDPNGRNVFPVNPGTLKSGEQTTLTFPIQIPAGFAPPGTAEVHGWLTEDDRVEQDAQYTGSLHALSEVDSPTQVDYGETIEVTVSTTNLGNAAGSGTLNLYVGGYLVDRVDVSGEAGESNTVTLDLESTQLLRDNYTLEVRLGGWIAWREPLENNGIQVVYSDDVWIGDAPLPEDAIAYYDTNNNETISDNEVFDAVSDWQNGEGFFEGIGNEEANQAIFAVVESWQQN